MDNEVIDNVESVEIQAYPESPVQIEAQNVETEISKEELSEIPKEDQAPATGLFATSPVAYNDPVHIGMDGLPVSVMEKVTAPEENVVTEPIIESNILSNISDSSKSPEPSDVEIHKEQYKVNAKLGSKSVRFEVLDENITFVTSYQVGHKKDRSDSKWVTQILKGIDPCGGDIKSPDPLYTAAVRRDADICKQLENVVTNVEDVKLILNKVQRSASAFREQLDSLVFINEAQDEEDDPLADYSQAVIAKANELLNSGQAQDFIIQKHCDSYAGMSDRISWALTGVFATTHITSSAGGIHLKISGPSGCGKNKITEKFFDLVPPGSRTFTSMSGKNMFYDEDLQTGMVVGIDEFENSDTTLIRTIKLSTGDFQHETKYKTVIEAESATKRIPSRVSFVLLSVVPLDNEEMISRFLTVDVPKSASYLLSVNAKQKQRDVQLITKNNEPDFDTQVCRCIYSILYQKVYEIRIPFAPVIEWPHTDYTRNWEIFTDIIRCVAFYNIRNREYFQKPNDPDTGAYFATYDDYVKAVEIYEKLSDNNTTKLSNNELKIIGALTKAASQDMRILDGRQLNKAEVFKHLENHTTSELTFSDLLCFGIMDFSSLGKVATLADKTVESIIRGKQNAGGLTDKIVGLHCEKYAIKVNNRIVTKNLVWYDGPADFTTRRTPIVPRDICEIETENTRQQLLYNWKVEDAKQVGSTT